MCARVRWVTNAAQRLLDSSARVLVRGMANRDAGEPSRRAQERRRLNREEGALRLVRERTLPAVPGRQPPYHTAPGTVPPATRRNPIPATGRPMSVGG